MVGEVTPDRMIEQANTAIEAARYSMQISPSNRVAKWSYKVAARQLKEAGEFMRKASELVGE